MSIDAKITEGFFIGSGSFRLKLGPSQKGAIPGQDILDIINPIEECRKLVGKTIWGCSTYIYCGDETLGKRIELTKLRIDWGVLQEITSDVDKDTGCRLDSTDEQAS